jgi:4,5-DOPA dioxygenase extradiol
MQRPSREELGRRGFLAALTGLAAAGCRAAEAPAKEQPPAKEQRMTASSPSSSGGAVPSRQPVLFVGHGSPMNAIEDNRWSRAFRALGQSLPTPRAVLAISAHWFVSGTHVTDNAHPQTIHDFGGFPRELFEMIYPAPGDPALAERVRQLLAAHSASARSDWGLDHGTWSVLCHVRPDADVPVLQLSIDARLTAAQHIAIGQALSPLRDEGVLILGSGNIVHNLRDAFGNMRAGRTATPRWASDFDAATASAIGQRDAAFLGRSLETDTGRQAHPTPEHYLPLLYAFGASSEADAVSYPIEGFDAGSLSMRSVRFG